MNAFMNPTEAEHGGINRKELEQLGLDPDTVVDLSSNILFAEPVEFVQQAISKAVISRYPDRDCLKLKTALAERHSIDADNILVGNGCTELIHLVARTLLKAEDKVLIVGPTFAEYQRASLLAKANVFEVRSSEADDFIVSLEEINQVLENQNYQMVWVCNPSNPTGQSIDGGSLRQLISAHPQTIFVIDESYIDFSDKAESLICDATPNLIVLRSMTKAYAMPGLRLGYLVTSVSLISLLIENRIPWSVNEIAQAAGIAALQSQTHYDLAMQEMKIHRKQLISGLQARGYQPLSTDTGFLLVPVRSAKEFRTRLLPSGVVVRDCESFGLKDYVRIAVGNAAANKQLFNALDGVKETPIPKAIKSDSTDEPWDCHFKAQLYELFSMRRDVRNFRPNAIPQESLTHWIEAAGLAPSVGLSQPWRIVSVSDQAAREQIIKDYQLQNQLAAALYDEQTQTEYQQLKLAGLQEAPEQLAIFAEPEPEQGRGLGRRTMPETVTYSVVAAIQNFWLAARSEGVGVGWVSILNPERIKEILNVPDHWQLVAYLCVGYPAEKQQKTPELERLGWEQRAPTELKMTLAELFDQELETK